MSESMSFYAFFSLFTKYNANTIKNNADKLWIDIACLNSCNKTAEINTPNIGVKQP